MFQGMEYVYEVYKEGSFSKAAANLYISQPSLSANVKRVENKVGFPIFDRSTKPLKLTECGREYIKAVERILEAQSEFGEYVNDFGALRKGTLSIGGSNLFTSWFLPKLIARFAKKYPEIQITMVEENSAKLSEMVSAGTLDIMMDNLVLAENEYDKRIYRKEQLLLAVPAWYEVNEELKDYRMTWEQVRGGEEARSKVKEVPLSYFSEYPFVMLRKGNDTGNRARMICKENGLKPQVAFEMDQQMTAYNVTCSGLGISFVGNLLISRTPVNDKVVFYRLPGNVCEREVYVYWKKGRYVSRAMEEFLDLTCLEE